MSLDRELMGQVRSLDEHDLRRLAIFVTGLIQARSGDGRFAVPADRAKPPGPPTYRQQWVKCGKKTCTRCPHGPYWYAYWRQDSRLRSRYVGKDLPAGVDGDSDAG